MFTVGKQIMASSQQTPSVPRSTPEYLELRDERAPGRMKALRAFVAVSALGWLAFAVLVSASAPEPTSTDAVEPAILLSQDTSQG